MFYEKRNDGVRLAVKVVPKASMNKIIAGEDGLLVMVTCVPEDGKANAAVVQLVAKALHVAKSCVSVVLGQTSRQKVLHIAGDPDTLAELIEREFKP